MTTLAAARRNIHKLAAMHAAVAKECDALALEVIDLKWRVSDMLREQGITGAAKINLFENFHWHGDVIQDWTGGTFDADSAASLV